MSTPLMEVADLAVHYPTRHGAARALDGVSLEWRRGEILGVVGESGCGKSTLARAMLGLVPAAAGTVATDGAEVSGRAALRALRRNVHLIFQDPYQTLNPRRRVGDIVAEALVVGEVPRAEHAARVERALDEVGMAPARFIGRYLGRIVEQGDARDVIERPGHPYTQELFDAVPPRKRRKPLGGKLPDAADIPSGCRFHPRCPKRFEPCDREDPPLFPAGEPAHRAACLLLGP